VYNKFGDRLFQLLFVSYCAGHADRQTIALYTCAPVREIYGSQSHVQAKNTRATSVKPGTIQHDNATFNVRSKHSLNTTEPNKNVKKKLQYENL